MCEVLDKMISEGYNKGISIGRSEAKKEYEKELASLKAKLARYEAQERRS